MWNREIKKMKRDRITDLTVLRLIGFPLLKAFLPGRRANLVSHNGVVVLRLGGDFGRAAESPGNIVGTIHLKPTRTVTQFGSLPHPRVAEPDQPLKTLNLLARLNWQVREDPIELAPAKISLVLLLLELVVLPLHPSPLSVQHRHVRTVPSGDEAPRRVHTVQHLRQRSVHHTLKQAQGEFEFGPQLEPRSIRD